MEIQGQMKEVQESIVERVVSSNGDVEICVNGLLRITDVKIRFGDNRSGLEESILLTANTAFDLVSEKSKREIALIAQKYGLTGS